MAQRESNNLSSTELFSAGDSTDQVMASAYKPMFSGAIATGASGRDLDAVTDSIVRGISRYSGPALLAVAVASLAALII